jgi:hypothetical protein
MPIHFDFGKDLLDFPLLADDESRALEPHDLFAIHHFFFVDSIGRGRFFLSVGEKWHVQAVAVAELCLLLNRISANTNDGCSLLFNFSQGIAEPASLPGSAGSICFRVEK